MAGRLRVSRLEHMGKTLAPVRIHDHDQKSSTVYVAAMMLIFTPAAPARYS